MLIEELIEKVFSDGYEYALEERESLQTLDKQQKLQKEQQKRRLIITGFLKNPEEELHSYKD